MLRLTLLRRLHPQLDPQTGKAIVRDNASATRGPQQEVARMSSCTTFSKPNRVRRIVDRQFDTAGFRRVALRNRIARVLVVTMLAAGALLGSGPVPALAADAVRGTADFVSEGREQAHRRV